jgi:hypothetical protein
LLNGGNVLVLPPKNIPDQNTAAAILRFWSITPSLKNMLDQAGIFLLYKLNFLNPNFISTGCI